MKRLYLPALLLLTLSLLGISLHVLTYNHTLTDWCARATWGELDTQPGAENQPRKLIVKANCGAQPLLYEYQTLYSPTTTKMAADPDDPSTITEFWQAAAMIDWFLRPPLKYTCKNRLKRGNWAICQDEPYTVRPPCLVYSFGINWDFRFDDAMARLGCEVHSFDPSMTNMTNHRRGRRVYFHKLGISHEDNEDFNPKKDQYVRKQQTWKMKTLKTIMEDLGHENRVIDVLKIDVEGYEWNITQNLLDTGVLHHVRQLVIEWHLFRASPRWSEYVSAYRSLESMREMGFSAFYLDMYRRYLKPDSIHIQADAEYVNRYFNRKPGWL